jgi:hypothetical protein
MAEKLSDRLRTEGVLAHVPVDQNITALLEATQIEPDAVQPGPAETGTSTIGIVENKALGFFDLNLTPPLPNMPYRLSFEGPPAGRTGFRFAYALSQTPPPKKLFEFIGKVPNFLRAASEEPGGETLQPDPDPTHKVSLTGIELALVIKGSAGGEANMMLSPSLEGPDGLVVLGLDPPTVALGSTGFGLKIDAGIAFDDAVDAVAPGTTMIDGVAVRTPADDPAWRGTVVRNARLYLPEGVPFLGGHAVDAHIEIGIDPTPGLDLVIETKVPAKEGRPEIDVRIECHDPTATGMAAFVPTLVEAAMTLPLDQREEAFDARSIKFAAGKPVTVRARFSRSPHAATPQTDLTLAVESQGSDGILSVSTETGGTGAKAIVTAGALLTAIVADKNIGERQPGGDETGVWLHALLVAASGLSVFLQDKGGKIVLHGAKLKTEGASLPVGGKVELDLDYSVDVVVDTFDVGVLSIGMRPEQPMKVRVRQVFLTVDPSKSGLDMIRLGIDQASLEIEDPGGWTVNSPGSLFDVLGTRSGRGSMWIEVDLRFRLDLGPIKVSGATVRGVLDDAGHVGAELSGIDANIDLSPTIKGSGAFQLLKPVGPADPPGFGADLSVAILPIGVDAEASLELKGKLVALSLACDLPGAVPLANTGLGLFGLGGVFAANGRPRHYDPQGVDRGQDIVTYQLNWDYDQPNAFEPEVGSFTFGLEGVIGTAPDLGFSFSARAGLFLTTPDIVVRGALTGKVLAPRVTESRPGGGEPDLGVSAKGVVVVDLNAGVVIGIEGKFTIPNLVEVIIPIGASFPTKSHDWYLYIGADGAKEPAAEGRGIGPVRATILPGVLDLGADAYLMFRGKGITNWPRGENKVTVADGFLLAFGFDFQAVFGLKPVVWAEVHAGADVLITTSPLMLAGFGGAGGSLHLGPVSVGVDANIEIRLAEKLPTYVYAELCGHVDLFFFSVSGCVDIEYNNKRDLSVPFPTEHPLDRIEGGAQKDAAVLCADRYSVIAPLARDIAGATTFWPDVLPHFTFAVAPDLADGFSPQFGGLATPPWGESAKPLGSDLLQYTWTLTGLKLFDVTGGAEVLVPGSFSGEWQYGKFGDAGGQAEAAELILLTPEPAVWIDRMVDGGEGAPHDPLQDIARICQGEVKALPGWALGGKADPTAPAPVLPPDPLSQDPVQSVFQATAQLGCNRFTGSLDIYSAQRIEPPLHYEPARRVAIDGHAIQDRPFDAYLQLGFVNWPPGFDFNPINRAQFMHTLALDTDDAITGARLWIVVDRDRFNASRVLFRASDNQQRPLQLMASIDLPGQDLAILLTPSVGDPISGLRLTWPSGVRLGILGLGGVTETARKAAEERNKGRAAAAQRAADGARNNPPPPDQAPNPSSRCVLEPGRTYRIDVEMTWAGTLYERDGNGRKSVASGPAPPDNAKYDPLATGKPEDLKDTKRSYFFKTAPLPDPGPPPVLAAPRFGESLHFAWYKQKQDLFQPEMLQRHLTGYEPAQSEPARFRNDPLRAHFDVGHVALLASRYKYNLKLGVRRLDVPGNEGNPVLLAASFAALKDARFAGGADPRRIAVYQTSPCALPRPGLTMEAPSELAALAWYEVFVLAQSQRAQVADGQLPGVSFRTSRWKAPDDMMAALHFPKVGVGDPPNPTGDLEVHSDAALGRPVVEGEDAAFDASLDALGLEGWPPVGDSPRVSVLWRRGDPAAPPVWLCAGILIESPEPIHRPGRVHVEGLRLLEGLAAGVASFDIRRRDRVGGRLLFMTATPFRPIPFLPRPGPPPRSRLPLFALDWRDFGPGTPDGGSPFTGNLALPLAPSFASEGDTG